MEIKEIRHKLPKTTEGITEQYRIEVQNKEIQEVIKSCGCQTATFENGVVYMTIEWPDLTKLTKDNPNFLGYLQKERTFDVKYADGDYEKHFIQVDVYARGK